MTATAALPTAVRRPGPRPRGLLWTLLRLHRTALWLWLAFVAATAGLLLWLLGPGADATQQKLDAFGYSGVSAAAWSSDRLGSFTSGTYNDLFYAPSNLITIASFAIALFAGGPLIARELENGTARLAWTQSVSPARWLAAKLAVPAGFIVLGMTLLVVLYRLLWSAHGNLLLAGIGPTSVYYSIGPSTVAAPLLGLALGAFAGLVLRRTLPALAAAGAGYFVVYAVLGKHWPSWAITSTGARVADPGCYDSQKCLAEHDIVGFGRAYLPSSDYWPRQLLETGVLLGLTALLVTAAFVVLRRKGTTA